MFFCLSLTISRAQEPYPLVSFNRFQPFRGNYILLTNMYAPKETKTQLSLKYDVLTSAPLYFGYTQKTFWDAWDMPSSFPFTEINFRPEGFVEWHFAGSNLQFFRTGYEHESNGKHAPLWRACDRVFAEIQTKPLFGLVELRTRAWVTLYTPPENSDITNYLGFGELEFRLSDPDNLALGLTVRKGAAGGLRYGSVELNLFFRPLALLGFEESSSLNSPWYLQLWTGMGERLLNYNVPTRSVRAGFHLGM